VPGAGNATAVVYESVVSTVPPETTYQVVLNVGKLSEGVSSDALTEAQMLVIGKTLAPVAPGA